MLKEKQFCFDETEKHCFSFLPKHPIFESRFFWKIVGILETQHFFFEEKLSQKIYSDSEQFQELKKLID